MSVRLAISAAAALFTLHGFCAVASNGREFISPEDYGGTDAERIEQAMAEAVRSGRNEVWLTGGRIWTLERALVVPGRFWLVVDGGGLRLREGVRDNVIRCEPGAKDVNIVGFGFRKPAIEGRDGFPAVVLDGADGFNLANLSFPAPADCAVRLTGACRNGSVRLLRFSRPDGKTALDMAASCTDVAVSGISGLRLPPPADAPVRALVPAPRSFRRLPGAFRAPDAYVTREWVSFTRDATLPREGYRLRVTPGGVTVAAADADAERHAMTTLRQLGGEKTRYLNSDAMTAGDRGSALVLPCCEITDWPRYRWRGVMLDECRHFFGKETVRHVLDMMAYHKLNVFHWHLTEDQGWRIAVDRYPRLATHASVRPRSPVYRAVGNERNNEKYGPYCYSKDDIREIVAYAAERGITVVPEIEFPGHIRAALAAYPEFSCRGDALPREPRTIWGIDDDVLCVGNDDAIRFVEDVIDEVAGLFPGEFFHIGGDECPSVRWKECPKCRARAKSLGIEPAKLQGWVTKRFAEYLRKKGKRAIGWDEIADCAIPVRTAVMNWREASCGVSAASRGHDIVRCPPAACYLSRGTGLPDDPFSAVSVTRNAVSLRDVYSFDPAEGFSADLQKRIMGAQACFWSEVIMSRFDLDWKMWPRVAALAEVLWTAPEKRDYAAFSRRVREHRSRLVEAGVNASPVPCAVPELSPPSSEETFAAKELSVYAADHAADVVPVTLDRGRGVLPERAVRALDGARSPDAFVIASAHDAAGARRVFIAGKTGRAVVYGVYAFLEDFLGWRFFHAGKGGTVEPEKGSRAVLPDDLFVFRSPRVSWRRISHWKGSVEPSAPIKEYEAWLIRRGFRNDRTVDGLRMMLDGVPLSMFDGNPRYFPEISGSRSLETAKKFRRRCCSNPDVQRLTAAKAVEHCRKGRALLLTVYNETGHWCECDGCRRAGTGKDGVFSVTDYVHRFHSAVASLVLEKLPDADISVHAYRDFRFPPKDDSLVYDPRVRVIYSPIPRCYAHPLADPCNGRYRREYLGWRGHARKMGVFGWSSSSRQRYTPIASTFARDIRWLVDNGFDGWLDNNTAGGSVLSHAVGDWRLFYLASKMFWDPSLDADALLEDADRRYYGAAYGPMAKFRALLLKRWAEAPGHAAAGASGRHLEALRTGDAEKMLGWLDEAEELAEGDDALLARIGYDRLGFTRYWIEDGAKEAERRAAFPTAAAGRATDCRDGFPCEADWEKAPWNRLLCGKDAPSEETRVALLRDGENWYVRFDQEFEGEPVSRIRARDGDIWTEDAVEVFATPPGRGWMQVIVSPAGVVYDADGPCGVDWSFGGDVRNIRRAGRLVTDIRLPAANLRGDDAGMGGTWDFRFTRDNARKGRGGEFGWCRVHVPR